MVKPFRVFRTGEEEVAGSQVGSIVKSGGTTVNYTNSEPGKTFSVEIIDVRTGQTPFNLVNAIITGLEAEGEKTLPTMLLYNNKGLKEFENITYCEDYYLTNSEIEVLENHAEKIAERIPDGSILMELGSGNLRKVNILLKALENAKKNIDYYALDLDRGELERTFQQLPKESFRYVKCHGLHGTYDEGRNWLLNCEELRDRPRIILWLGSSVGNDDREGASEFLAQWRREALRPGSADRFLIGIDSCDDPERVWRAYNDSEGITERFEMNGLAHANTVMGKKLFDLADWEYFGEYDVFENRHQASFKALKKVVLKPGKKEVVIEKGQKIRIERSHKYSPEEFTKLFEDSELVRGSMWGNSKGDYNLHMLYAPVGKISLDPKVYAKDQYPGVEEWKQLWAFWDLVVGMVPHDMELRKPIDLRNPYVFYFGHIPTFCDVQLSKAAGLPPTEPQNFKDIFQRGIDPDVDDPTKCHNHSEVPDQWPSKESINEYKRRVRARVADILERPATAENTELKRAIFLVFEHEVMHMETLLYMLIQDASLRAPAGVPRPDFGGLAALENTKAEASLDGYIKIPISTVKLGVNDEEENGGPFTWDNEKPARSATVQAFEAFSRPITNEEYIAFLNSGKKPNATLPASWSGVSTGSKFSEENITVKTVFGPIPFKYAAKWAVCASYDELNACAKWMGGRLPTREELQAVYQHIKRVKQDRSAERLAARFAAVNGHLSNNGINVTPPPALLAKGDVQDTSFDDEFVDLVGANVSFRQWHPSSIVGKLCGRADAGFWEWTSSVLIEHDGFVPMKEYPEYTADFFDGKHNVVLGGSWATHSRVSGRRSFVNWYQRNYPFAWITGRLVRDTPVS